MISDNLSIVRNKIEAASKVCGRKASDITLVAVTKKHPCEDIIEAVNCGVENIGENYVQEAVSKYAELGNIAEWHIIGHLQRNKVKYVVPFATLIHSVDSVALASEISKRSVALGRTTDILIEVKISEEETKDGANPEDVIKLAEQISDFDGIKLKGLMGMPPLGFEPRPYFVKLKSIWDMLPAENRIYLSMGMTGDFECAIEEGSNMVRIGTAIFGSRI